MSVTLILDVFSKIACCAFCSWHCPSQPFHAGGRFKLDASCMSRRGRKELGLVKERQQVRKIPTVWGVKHQNIETPREKVHCNEWNLIITKNEPSGICSTKTAVWLYQNSIHLQNLNAYNGEPIRYQNPTTNIWLWEEKKTELESLHQWENNRIWVACQ